jgi:ketosteroid isomerase-like protein
MPANDRTDPWVVELLNCMEEYRKNYDFGKETFNREAVAHLYKKDADFMAYDVAPPVGGYIGWDRYAVGWYDVMNKYKEIYFKFNDDLLVHRRGEVGWVSVSAKWYGISTGGESFNKDFRLTLVWVRENDAWVITHEHASAPRLTELASGEKV